MQLRLNFDRAPKPASTVIVAGGQEVPVEFIRHRRARHYVIRVREDGSVRVTIPRAGSRDDAERFLRERMAWIARQRARQAREAVPHAPWHDGSKVLVRGIETELRVEPDGSRLTVGLGELSFTLPAAAAPDLRAHVERRLRLVASRELPERLAELARAHGFEPSGAGVRNQKSRWGSCSPGGRISLNWRLIQLPPRVADYVLIHELVHLRHLNHSARFWREVDRLCPWHKEARAFLRRHRTQGLGQPS